MVEAVGIEPTSSLVKSQVLRQYELRPVNYGGGTCIPPCPLAVFGKLFANDGSREFRSSPECSSPVSKPVMSLLFVFGIGQVLKS